ncbi:MAG: TIGR00730 family Rossman fold protein [Alphaproteobacteria bacterium]|nr:MAG: TIGR00730 family Rossman fold protein [Alphaproteobacteria bacterium]
MSIRASVCVFCGSRPGHRPVFSEEARRLGEAIAANGWRLVYGAGDVGLMGVAASAAQATGGVTMGVIPAHLMTRERGKADLTQLVVTETMHERKKVMFMNSDAIVVLPGGAGTLDEFFEMLTWRQLHLHGKPIFLLNTEGFWDPLLALLDHVIEAGFADASLRDYVGVAPSAAVLEAELREALP